ncbi:MAG: hypothetical protein Q4F95_12530 [Oscillospiraceae bacterium]|nr:hypothetical protein [Oscillospiraceae bacterium]
MYKLLIAAACSILTVSVIGARLGLKTQDSAAIDLIDIYERPSYGVGAGETVDKQVGISNKGNVPVYVRVQADKSWTIDGIKVPDMNTDWININLPNINDWVYGGDGYYYYQYPLEPGESTSDLMNSFTISDDYKNTLYPGIEGNIIVSGESVAIEGFTPEYDENGKIIGWGDVSFDIEATVTTTPVLGSDIDNTGSSQTISQLPSPPSQPSGSEITSSHTSIEPDSTVSSAHTSYETDLTVTSAYTSYEAESTTAAETDNLKPTTTNSGASGDSMSDSSQTTADSGRTEQSSSATQLHIQSSPSTGDTSGILAFILAGISSAAAFFFTKQKNK